MNKDRSHPLRDSLRELQNTRNLATCAMLLAVQILLGYVGSINIGNTIRIGFGFLASATAAALFGPVPAMVNAALCDIISYVLRPTGPYHPGFTLTTALAGLIYGLFFYRRPVTARRAVLAKLTVDLLCNLALNTLWIHQLYGNAFVALLPPRAIKNMLQLPLDVVMLMALFRPLRRVSRSLGRAMPQPIPARRPARGPRLIAAAAALLWISAALWLNNTSLLVDASGRAVKWVAHRGLAQTFDVRSVAAATNTAERIDPPEHGYLENTIASMRRAFELGADCVELDLRLTKDDRLAVFHDDTVEYRTGAKGDVRDYDMAELKRLDVGYGYTADGGQTYPFRGQGVGLMPEFGEVLSAFPDRELLIHVKDGGAAAAEAAWRDVAGLGPEQLALLAFYGDDGAMARLRALSDELRTMSRSSLKAALTEYVLTGWSGFVPESMKRAELFIPARYARFLWGWPAKFVQRMDAVDTRVVLVRWEGDWIEGFDDAELLRAIPPNYAGYVWTNRIDRVGGAK